MSKMEELCFGPRSAPAGQAVRKDSPLSGFWCGFSLFLQNVMVSMDAEGSPGNDRIKSKSAITTLVNGQRLQAFRQQAGLTQEELAERSGYTDRLIRKAEASCPLRKSTIADLAEALSTPGRPVTVAELTFSHETLAMEVHALMLNCESDFAAGPKEFAHPKLVLNVAGDDLGIPFAGRFHGPDACRQFREKFAASFGSIKLLTDQTRSFTSHTEVCLHTVTLITPPPSSRPPCESASVWWFLKLTYEANRIINLDLMYDTGNICRLLGRFQKSKPLR